MKDFGDISKLKFLDDSSSSSISDAVKNEENSVFDELEKLTEEDEEKENERVKLKRKTRNEIKKEIEEDILNNLKIYLQVEQEAYGGIDALIRIKLLYKDNVISESTDSIKLHGLFI